MSITDIKVQLEAARRFEHEAGGAKFTLRLPSEHAMRVAYQENAGSNAKASRALLELALVGWEGVTAEHLRAGLGAEAVPFSTDARYLLLEARQDVADQLTVALWERWTKWADEQEAARKN